MAGVSMSAKGFKRLVLAATGEQNPGVGEMARDGGSGGHRGRHQMGPGARTLSSFEIAVCRRRASLPRGNTVAVHRHAHRTTRIDPFEAGVDEDPRETFFLCAPLDIGGARRDEARHDRLAARQHGCRGPKILYAAVGARTNEGAIDPNRS